MLIVLVSLLQSGLTCEVVLAIVACTLGSSFQFGYGIGVINTPQQVCAVACHTFNHTLIQQVITNWINESYARGNHHEHPSASTLTFIWSLIVSIFNVGGMIGALLSGLVSGTCTSEHVRVCRWRIGVVVAAHYSTTTYGHCLRR
jgi:MFS family permease